MNQKDLETKLAERTGLTKAEANDAVNALLVIIEESLLEGEKVILRNVGTLHIADSAPTRRYSPYHKEFVAVPAKRHLRLRPSNKFEDKLNG